MLRAESNGYLILTPGSIPTSDYYVTSRLGHLAGRVLWADSRRPPDGASLPHGVCVLIVRHASPAWLDFLADQRHRLDGVEYLMDDDIPGAWRCRDVPLNYGLWTSGRYWRIHRKLVRLCDRWWVSTPELARRYPGSTVLPPLPFAVSTDAATAGCRRWGYHGTRIHVRELRWIVPIVKAVQQAVPEAEFEVFGDVSTKRLFAHAPRVTVRPPLPWPEYIAHCRAHPLAVGLAPSLPGRFNSARAHTKVFDIMRCGAVGLFSDRAPYATALAGCGALLLPDDPRLWAQWTIRLLQEDDTRQRLFERMRDFVFASTEV